MHSLLHRLQRWRWWICAENPAPALASSTHDYITCIECYFVPYFGERLLEELTHIDIREFELWRDRQMRRKPATSTLNNFTSTWNKLIATAVELGLVSERVPVPKLPAKGEKGKPRPAFSKEEIDQLLAYSVH